MINKTELNKLRSQIDKNKVYIDSIKDLKIDDDKKHTMALSMSVLMEYFRVNQKMAYDSLTEGGGDNKIDALYYSDDSDEFTELVIIQSKFKQKDGDTDTLKEDEIKLCIKSCENILSGGVFQTTNKILEQKINNYRTLLKDNGLPPITIKLIFATNGIIHEGHKRRYAKVS